MIGESNTSHADEVDLDRADLNGMAQPPEPETVAKPAVSERVRKPAEPQVEK